MWINPYLSRCTILAASQRWKICDLKRRRKYTQIHKLNDILVMWLFIQSFESNFDFWLQSHFQSFMWFKSYTTDLIFQWRHNSFLIRLTFMFFLMRTTSVHWSWGLSIVCSTKFRFSHPLFLFLFQCINVTFSKMWQRQWCCHCEWSFCRMCLTKHRLDSFKGGRSIQLVLLFQFKNYDFYILCFDALVSNISNN